MTKEKGIKSVDYVFKVAKKSLVNSPYLIPERKYMTRLYEKKEHATQIEGPGIDFDRIGQSYNVDILRGLWGLRIISGGDFAEEISKFRLGDYFGYDGSVAFLHTRKTYRNPEFSPKESVGIYVILNNVDAKNPRSPCNHNGFGSLELYLAKRIGDKYFSDDIKLNNAFYPFYEYSSGGVFFSSSADLEEEGLSDGSDPINTKKLEERIKNTLKATNEFYIIKNSEEFRAYKKIFEKIKDKIWFDTNRKIIRFGNDDPKKYVKSFISILRNDFKLYNEVEVKETE